MFVHGDGGVSYALNLSKDSNASQVLSTHWRADLRATKRPGYQNNQWNQQWRARLARGIEEKAPDCRKSEEQ
jgi:hypothetical protein